MVEGNLSGIGAVGRAPRARFVIVGVVAASALALVVLFATAGSADPSSSEVEPTTRPVVTTTTTLSPKEVPPPEDPPEEEITVEFLPLAVNGEVPDGARRILIETDTGEILASALPGQELVRGVFDGGQEATNPYQSDTVWANDITHAGAYAVDLWAYIWTPQCSDSETCESGSRKTDGYVWFTALNTHIGSTPSECLYAMHAGIAMGNGIGNADWYFTWGGYSGCGSTQIPPGGIGNEIALDHNKWYRIRIWRVTESSPGTWDWIASVTDWATGVEQQAGSFSLDDGEMLSNVQYFTEVAEPDACVTDYTGTSNKWIEFRDPLDPHPHRFAQGTVAYEANGCTDTNLRLAGADVNRFTVNQREVTRNTAQAAALFDMHNWHGTYYTSGSTRFFDAYGVDDAIPIPGNWDSDAITEAGVYDSSTHKWDREGLGALTYGASDAIPLSGDWDGNGVDEPGYYRPSTKRFYRYGHSSILFGGATDVPLVGNWDGVGGDEVGVFVTSGKFRLRSSNGATVNEFWFGAPNDTPVIGDWNSDGVDTVGVERNNGHWYFTNTNEYGVADYDFWFGIPSDTPVVGDWDGDGNSNAGMVRHYSP